MTFSIFEDESVGISQYVEGYRYAMNEEGEAYLLYVHFEPIGADVWEIRSDTVKGPRREIYEQAYSLCTDAPYRTPPSTFYTSVLPPRYQADTS